MEMNIVKIIVLRTVLDVVIDLITKLHEPNGSVGSAKERTGSIYLVFE